MRPRHKKYLPVALYFYKLGNSSGGAERIICALANELFNRGYAVHLISWDDKNARPFYPLKPGIVWHRLDFQRGNIDKARRSLVLAKLLKDNDVQTLVGFVMSGDKTVYAAVKMAGARLVVAERNAPSMFHLRYGNLQRLIVFACLHLADRITLQFPEYTDGYPIGLHEKIEIIPNPVKPAFRFAQPDTPTVNGRFTLLTVSRLDCFQKRLGCLIRAFAQVACAQSQWDLRIVGDGPDNDALCRLIRENRLSDRVIIEKPFSDISEAYIQAHLFVIPSLWEGFPNALAEAMSHGLPAVGFSGAEGVANLIKDGETGWLAEGLDNDLTLSCALERALRDHDERARRGVRAVESMAAYTPEVQFDRWAVLIDSLASEREN